MASNSKMTFRIGPPATGANFFPRPNVCLEIREALENGHVSLLAPRRTGKTSILYYLKDNPENDTTFISINLEKFKTPDEWIESMLLELLKLKRFSGVISSLGKGFNKIVEEYKRIESIGVSGFGSLKMSPAMAGNWRNTAADLLNRLSNQQYPVVFLLDEFPILVNHMAGSEQDVEGMLRWFREWRQNPENTKVKFLVTGSIGLDSVVRRLGLWDTINDFNPVELPPLTASSAGEFITKLSVDNEIHISDDVKEKILELLGVAWPYFIQIFLSEIKNRYRREKRPITVVDLDDIYLRKMIAGVKNNYLPHMYDRINKIFDDSERNLARRILKSCCTHEEGVTGERLRDVYIQAVSEPEARDEAQLNYVLDVLKHDGYLIQTLKGEQRTRFFSNMLRDYWKRKVA